MEDEYDRFIAMNRLQASNKIHMPEVELTEEELGRIYSATRREQETSRSDEGVPQASHN